MSVSSALAEWEWESQVRVTPTEAETQKACLELLAAHKIFAFRLNTAGVKMAGRYFQCHSLGQGAADIVALYDHGECSMCGRIIQPIWIEVKAPRAQQSPEQITFQVFVKSLGHIYLLIRSIDQLAAWLKENAR
jgi:hypothetical protein